MQKNKLVIKPLWTAKLYYYRKLYMKRLKGSYQGNTIVNLVLYTFYIPAAFLFFYNIYYGIFIFLIGLFFVALQDLHILFPSDKIKYIISQNEIKIVDKLNNKIATMLFENKLNIKIIPSFRGDIYGFNNLLIENRNDEFCLLGIPKKSVQEILDFIKNKKINFNSENKESIEIKFL